MSQQSHQPTVDALVIGAGPFGLSLAARLQYLGLDIRVAGESMAFWRHNMPAGMFLRSSWDWHLDPQEHWTIERYLQERGLEKAAVNPVPIADYLDYVEWFQQGSGIVPNGQFVERIVRDLDGVFSSTLTSGEVVRSRTVAVSLGFSSFAAIPQDVASRIPAGRTSHTLSATDFSQAAGTRVLIVGGRQSAFEWAALLCEAGAEAVHIVHRHPSPAFAEADWTWVPPLMDEMTANPSWFRSLTAEQQEVFRKRLWAEGRLKVEPWLEPRIMNSPVSIWPETEVTATRETPDGVDVTLSNGTRVTVDQIILATGYMPDISRISLLQNSPLSGEIATDNGLPLLDTGFQSSVPGLYLTSLLASRDFGPFFGFTVAARGAAVVLGDALAQNLERRS